MKKLFEIILLEDAMVFLRSLESKHSKKILFNIGKAQIENNPELLKKLYDDIWEFRTLYKGLQYRFLAFWDKSSTTKTLVIATHGFIKKRSDIPKKEIEKAIKSRVKYFEEKHKNKRK